MYRYLFKKNKYQNKNRQQQKTHKNNNNKQYKTTAYNTTHSIKTVLLSCFSNTYGQGHKIHEPVQHHV